MSTFIALIALLTAAALCCLLPPLLRTAAVASGPESAQRPARRTALALALLLPAAAVLLYLQVGRPQALNQAPAQMTATPSDHGADEADVPAMVERLAVRLRTAPDDIEGWHMLARSYSAMGRYADSAKAFAHLATLLPEDAGLLADYADTLATANGGTLAGEPERLVQRALALDPQQPKALSLAGSAAFARGDFARARLHWQAVLPLVPADSEFARSTAAGIAEAEARLSGAAATTPAPDRAAPGAALPAATGVSAAAMAARSGAGRLTGTVRLAPGSAALDGNLTVFVYARPADGSGMPLAALKRKAGELPFTFTLDDSMAMAPGRSLSDWRQVLVGARISSNGSATPQAGDLEASIGPVPSNSSDLVIEIKSPAARK